MSDGKMNYERQRARAEIREEMSEIYGEPQDVQMQRRVDQLAIFAGAMLLRSFGKETDAVDKAASALDHALHKAKQMNPGPDTEDTTNE